MELFRLACGMPKIRLGRMDLNRQAMEEMARAMAREEVDLALFPEGTLTGHTVGDLSGQEFFCQRAWEEAESLTDRTQDLDLALVFGLPLISGGGTYWAMVLAYRGDLIVLGKRGPEPPEESPFFLEEASHTFKSLSLASISDDQAARLSPDRISEATDLFLLAQARPFLPGKAKARRKALEVLTADGLAMAMVSACPGESTTDRVYSTQALIAENGHILAEKKEGEGEGFIYADLDPFLLKKARERYRSRLLLPRVQTDPEEEMDPPFHQTTSRTYPKYPFLPEDDEGLEETLSIQALGLAQRMSAIGTRDVWVGISGGLDSTLALLVALRTFNRLGLEDKGIHAVSMPAFGSSEKTKENARKLARSLDLDFREIDLEEVLRVHFRDIGLEEGDRSLAFENAQARERTQILFDLANLHGGLVLGTGDLSEIALGWATYNGDHMSSYGVNASIPKTLARALVRYEADGFREKGEEELARVLLDVVETPVSPELLPPKDGEIAQKTEEIIGPYDLHDFFLYYFALYGAGPRRILDYADRAFEEYSRKEILACLRIFYDRFFKNQFKRSAMPDGPQASPVSLSPRGNWTMASDLDGRVFLEEVDALLEGEK